jgi:hypothetical protein
MIHRNKEARQPWWSPEPISTLDLHLRPISCSTPIDKWDGSRLSFPASAWNSLLLEDTWFWDMPASAEKKLYGWGWPSYPLQQPVGSSLLLNMLYNDTSTSLINFSVMRLVLSLKRLRYFDVRSINPETLSKVWKL